MLRSSREVHNRSQQSLADQQLRETVRSSKYDQEHRTLQRRQQHYEQQYRKAFLRNSPSPRQDLPETVFYSTLRERAQKIT
jgi:Ulp1 family protease